MPDILGVRTTINLLASEDPQDFIEGIGWLYPKGYTNAPLMALISTLPRESTSNRVINHYEEGFPTMTVTVASTVAASGATSITTSETGGALITRLFTQLRNERTGEIFLATADGSGQTITIADAYRAFSTTIAAIMSAGDTLTVIGSATPEAYTSPTPQSSKPTLVTNYTQEIRESFALSNIVADSSLRTGNQYSNDHFRALSRWATKAENAFFWSELATATDTGGTTNYAMRGLSATITTNVDTINGLISQNTIKTHLKNVFKYGNQQKICFCGNDFLQAWMDIIEAKPGMQIRVVPGEDKFGLGFTEYMVPYGTVFIKPSPLFNANPAWIGHAFFLDVPNLTYRYFINNDLDLHENILTDNRPTYRKDEFAGIISLETWFEQTHSKILGVTGWSGN